jgi:phosphatidylinositol alpha-1,6-mannosyltransferase
VRALLVSTEFPPHPGGIGTHTFQIAKNLERLGWDVMVLAKQETGSDLDIKIFNEAQSFKVVTVQPQAAKSMKFLHWMRRTSAAITTYKPDAVVASGVSAVLVAGFVSAFQHPRLVAIAHGEFPQKWQMPWLRWSYAKAKAMICVSEYTRERMEAAGIRSQLTVVIPNGGDSYLFKPLPSEEISEFRKSLGLENAKIVLTVGKVSERKGQDVMIRALPHVLEKVPDTHYFIVGSPALQNHFADLGRKLGVSEFVHFTGVVEPEILLRYFNACDLFVMLSRHTDSQYEAYGIAVIEAALCGKPAVVTANSGLRESIIPDRTGMLVPENDESAAAEAVIRLLQNQDLRQRMGRAARENALQNATWEQRAQSYDSLLRKIIALSQQP